MGNAEITYAQKIVGRHIKNVQRFYSPDTIRMHFCVLRVLRPSCYNSDEGLKREQKLTVIVRRFYLIFYPTQNN